MKVPIWSTMRMRLFLCRSALLVMVPLVLHPMHLSAENRLESAYKNSALIQAAGDQGRIVAHGPSQSGIAHGANTQALAVALNRARHNFIAGTSLRVTPTTEGWLEKVVASEIARQRVSRAFAKPMFQPPPQQGKERKRGWIKRHPALFGALVGFGGGFLIGYAAGDDGIFYDLTAEASGLVLGGIGAGAGAALGGIIGAVRK